MSKPIRAVLFDAVDTLIALRETVGEIYAVNLSLVGFSQQLGDPRGQVLALFVIAVAAAEAGVGLGLVIALNRNRPGAGIGDLTELKW